MSIKLKLHDEASWIVAHAWSTRFLFAAGFVQVTDAMLPLMSNTSSNPGNPWLVGGLTALALVARFVKQKRPTSDVSKAPNGE